MDLRIREVKEQLVINASVKAIKACVWFLEDLRGDSFATREERNGMLLDTSYARETLHHVYDLEVYSFLSGYKEGEE